MIYQIFEEYNNANENTYEVMIIGVGQNNFTSISDITDNKITPWVKDINENDTWISWQASNRDLYFIDKNGKYYSKENLTQGFDMYFINGIVNNLINQ